MFKDLLLDIWREVGRHQEIGDCAGVVTNLITQHMPLDGLVVRRIDRERCCLDTIAVTGSQLPNGRTDCTADEMQQLLAWCRAGRARRRPPITVCAGLKGDVIAGPLGLPDSASGLLVLAARPETKFAPEHLAWANALLDPFTVALENEYRLHELDMFREAAEAEKEALLHRLGRKGLEDTIIGAESGLRSVMERVALVAKSDLPVLILGETGTGKELVARAIHRRSPRANGPIIRVNCGAIPPELIDSQLFGHEPGAFTGAVTTHKGWFERADGGTLFLDEMGELPLAAQVRLLRILQDGWLERIGGRQPIHVDVRIVVSTHRDLPAMVNDGRFREDPWDRIAGFPILLPPLRERQEDIPLMARHFAERAALRFGLPVILPTNEDLALLQSYPWPGNVRELGAVMDRAALVGNGRQLDVVTALGVIKPQTSSAIIPPAEPPQPGFLTLDEATRRHIEAALAATHGRIEGAQGAAKLLGINPHTLRARMRKLSVKWSTFRLN
jgi:hydrogenase-4 transcriptional activator